MYAIRSYYVFPEYGQVPIGQIRQVLPRLEGTKGGKRFDGLNEKLGRAVVDAIDRAAGDDVGNT